MCSTTAMACPATSRAVQPSQGDDSSQRSTGARRIACSSSNNAAMYMRRFALIGTHRRAPTPAVSLEFSAGDGDSNNPSSVDARGWPCRLRRSAQPSASRVRHRELAPEPRRGSSRRCSTDLGDVRRPQRWLCESDRGQWRDSREHPPRRWRAATSILDSLSRRPSRRPGHARTWRPGLSRSGRPMSARLIGEVVRRPVLSSGTRGDRACFRQRWTVPSLPDRISCRFSTSHLPSCRSENGWHPGLRADRSSADTGAGIVVPGRQLGVTAAPSGASSA